MTVGGVESYDEDEGVGVPVSQETPGGCWFHYSQWPFSEVYVGTMVNFDWYKVKQDGYDYACSGDITVITS